MPAAWLTRLSAHSQGWWFSVQWGQLRALPWDILRATVLHALGDCHDRAIRRYVMSSVKQRDRLRRFLCREASPRTSGQWKERTERKRMLPRLPLKLAFAWGEIRIAGPARCFLPASSPRLAG